MLIQELYILKRLNFFSEGEEQETNSTKTGEETDPEPEPESSPEGSSGLLASISIPFILLVLFN